MRFTPKATQPASKLLLNPGAIFPQMVVALSGSRKLGIVLPSIDQIEPAQRYYGELGANAVATYAALDSGATSMADMAQAGEFLAEQGAEIIWMPCLGMDATAQGVVRQIVQRPVLLSRSILAKVIDELSC